MGQWLVVALHAPLASFGEAPGNALRQTADMPTRSALIGLAAAALGVEREEAARQTELFRALVTACGLYQSGWPLEDFHTYQTLNKAAKGAATRAGALQNRKHLETSITRRHYRVSGLWQGAYRLSDRPGNITLEALKAAFLKPCFVPYLGRKSCPLCLPLHPQIIEASDALAAMRTHASDTSFFQKTNSRLQLISLEHRADGPATNQRPTRHTRNDNPLDRSIRWMFAPRDEWRFAVSNGTPKENAP
jgi:CRISPR system Cascade subunit CasD